MEFSTVSGLVGAILTVVLAVILILPITMGIFRGAKKSAFRLVWVLGFGLLAFALVGVISNALINLDISFLNLTVNDQQATTIPQYVELLLSSQNADLANVMADNPEVYQMVASLVVSVINLIVIVLLYWLLKWILWPVWAILAKVLFKNKKVENKKIIKDGKVIAEKQQVVKEKKRAWLGAIFGFIMGLVSLVFTVIPLAGISDTLIRIEQATLTTQADGTQKGLLTSNLGENAGLIYVYTNSPAGKVLSAVGINQLDTAIAKGIATTTTNGVKTSALDEIVNIATISNDAQTLAETDFANLSKEQWTETLPKINNVANKVLSSGIVKTLYNNLVPYFIDNMLANPDYFIQLPDFGDDVLNNLAKDVLAQIKTISVDDIKNDLEVMISMVGDINNSNILTELVKGEIELEYLQENVTTELGATLNEKLFEINSVSKLLPICLERAVEYACNRLDIDYVESSANLTAEQTETFFDSLVNDAVLILKGYDDTQDLPLASTTFENVGDVVDALKQSGIVSNQTFNNVVDYVVDKVEAELDNTNLKTSIDSLVRDMLADVKYIPSYKTELKQIGLAYQTILDEEIDIENLELKPATKVLDKVLTTFLYQYNLDSITTCIEDILIEYMTDSDIDISSQTIKTICADIKNVYSFEFEYGKMENLVEYLQEILEQGEFESHLKNQTTMSTLGEHLDTTVANGSILLRDSNCKLILQDIIKNVQLPADLQNTKVDGQDILVVMSNNTNKITSYQTEFVYVAKILSIDGAMTLSQYGEALDGVKNSVLLDGILNQVVADKITEKADLIDDAEVAEIVKGITSNIDNITSYQTEFEYVDKLVNLDFDTATLSTMGQTLDSVKNSVLLGSVLDDLITLQIERKTKDITDADLITIVDKVKGNVANIQSYQTEFEYLQSFVDLDAENASMTDFGAMLDSFVDSTLFGNTTNDLLAYALNKGKAEVDEVYEPILNKVIENAQNINGKIYEQELAFVQSFVDFTNNGEPKTSQNIQDYLDQNILDADGNSKSVLIDDQIVNDILELAEI